MKEKLTKKQQAFCRHFARTRNGREAAAAAGFGVVIQVLCWLVAAVTVLSGSIYLWQNRECFSQAK